MDRLLQDLAFAFRSLRRRPVVAIVPVFTLALGIGASTAVFSVFDSVLLTPPPYREPDRLVLLWHRLPALGIARARVAAPDVAVYREGADAFEGLAFVAGADDSALEGTDATHHVRVGVATPNLFRVLGVEAQIGRTFQSNEGVLSAAQLADPDFQAAPGPILLGYEIWSQRFGRDEGVVGRTLRFGGAPRLVVGVLPPDFELLLPPGTGVPTDIDAWTPLAVPPYAFRRPEGLRDQDSDNTGAVIGRLRPDVSLDHARQQMAILSSRQREAIPQYREAGLTVEVVHLQDDAVQHAKPLLFALMGAVTFVLLIACSNVGNILLARASDRRAEMAVRAALGAGPGRLVRQVLTEAGLLGLGGGLLGVLFASWAVDALLAFGPTGLPSSEDVKISGSVLSFAAIAGVGATMIFGSMSAMAMSRRRTTSLGASGPRGGGGRTQTLRRGLVIWEVAMSFALLVGAGLMLRTSASLQRVDAGFEADGLLTLSVALPAEVGGPGDRARFVDAFERQIRELPGTEAVGTVGGLPLGDVVFRQPYGLEGSTPDEWSGNEANFRVITSEYFAAMGTRLLAGRSFTPAENISEDERVAIVDAKLAEKLAPGGNAVGRRIGFPLDGDPIFATIVGVAEDVRFHDLRETGRETIYVPYRQEASRAISMAVRTTRDSQTSITSIQEIARGLSGDVPIPVYAFRDMESFVSRALAPTRFAMGVIGFFAAVAVGLAAVGLFGVISYAVSRRTREFGIRLALGAPTRRVLSDVLAGGLGLTAIGLVIGAGLAFAGASATETLLFGVGRADLPTYGLVAILVLAVTILATWLPARRAASVEPLAALKHE